MPWNKKHLSGCKLYVILDREVAGYPKLFEILKKAAQGGVDILQVRDKKGSAREIIDFVRKARKHLNGRIPLIVNDRVDVALLAGADGVHLGQEDIALKDARNLLGPKAIIGVSCQTLAHARQAQKDGADYVGFGSVFKTLTKPERVPMNLKLLTRVAQTIPIPVFAIGGINRRNIGKVLDTGITRVAVCREILLAKDVARSVWLLKNDLNSKTPSRI